MVSITVKIPGKPPLPLEFDHQSASKVTVAEVKAAIQKKYSKFEPNRQRLTLPVGESKPTPLVDESQTLASYGVVDGTTLRLKDLGRQTAYRNLYIWEYIGVIFINPLFLHYSYLLWGHFEPSDLQKAVRNLTVIHFVKREFESLFVHSFSRPTLPLTYVFRNALFYWGVVGLLMGLTLYRPAYGAVALKDTILDDKRWIYFWGTLILVCENLNFFSHLYLASLRTPKGTPRRYPTNKWLGFGYIVCANYFWETLGIVSLLIMTMFDLGTFVYNCIGIYFMYRWSGQKYVRYKKEFDSKVYPGKRYRFFPPLC